MTFYIQYDEAGNISGTVNTPTPPDHPRQLAIEDGWIPTMGKRVNLETLQLEDIPTEG